MQLSKKDVMVARTQEQLIADIKTQIYQYVYRSTDMPFTVFVNFTQEISTTLNFSDNKMHLINTFAALNAAITEYKLEHGDFRSYLHLALVTILTNEYLDLLLINYTKTENILPESISGSLESATTTSGPQNSNYPDPRKNTETVLIPKSKYTAG